MIKRLLRFGLLSVISLFIIILFVSYLNHYIKLSKEEDLFVPMGEMVEVNSHDMHIYTEGNGEETLVFMAGGGTSSPVLDFKSLFTLLSDHYRIVVIEKFGYGFSDITNTDRHIDTIVAESREGLHQLGIDGPYVLVPHSMSGIEALRWSQSYPDEVKAIIGLDMAVPQAYEHLPIPKFFLSVSSFAAKAGITRWLPDVSKSDAVTYGTLTDEEKELSDVVFYRRTLTKNMLNEIKSIQDNARFVSNTEYVEVPMLLFSSNGKETGLDEAEWLQIQRDFANERPENTLIELDAAHYIHTIQYETIAEDITTYIEQLNENMIDES